MRNLHHLFVLCTASQIIDGDFSKLCGLLRINELYEYFFQERIRPKRQQWWHVFTDVINRNSIIKNTGRTINDVAFLGILQSVKAKLF